MPDPFLSVIIPVGPVEQVIPQGLLQDLTSLPQDIEIIFAVCQPEQLALAEHCEVLNAYQVRWILAKVGRAQQMNHAAREAKGDFLWFLHIDSRFDSALVKQFLANLGRWPDRFHYCLLGFAKDGPEVMPVNAWGANLRSRLLGVPFGDQGFGLSRKLFKQIGGYPEDVEYGEDHLFVWYVRQQGIKLKCCTQTLFTSARKYDDKGWWAITCLYQRLWLKQAWPEFKKLLKARYF